MFPKLKPLIEQCRPEPLELKNISFSVDNKPITTEHLEVSINTPQGSPKSAKSYEQIKEELKEELQAPPPSYASRKSILQKKVQIEMMSPVKIPDETKTEPLNEPIEQV